MTQQLHSFKLKVSVRRCPALPMHSLCAGRGLGVPAIFLGLHLRRQFFRVTGVAVFSAPIPNNAPVAFWEAFWGYRWRCSKH
jgi:hypothetical protein